MRREQQAREQGADPDTGTINVDSSEPRPALLGPLLLYLTLATVVMLPLCWEWKRDAVCGDWGAHTCGILEYRAAMAEGQFPARVAPTMQGGIRYALPQFYGQFPYAVAALLHATGPDVWWACRLVVLLSITLAGFFLYRSAHALTGRHYPSLIAGACFVCGPYLLVDIHTRFAYPEVVALCLLPAVFFFTLRALTSRSAGYVLGGGVAWGLLALSHNITFLYASAFFGLYFGSYLLAGRQHFWGAARVGLVYSLGLVLAAWYIVAHFYEVPFLTISSGVGTPFGSAYLTPLTILLSPTMSSPAGSSMRGLGLQVGWPVLAAFGVTACSLFGRSCVRHLNRPAMVRLLVLFSVAFLIAWAPIDFWAYLPTAFQYAQFPYRMLIYTLLWGSVLGAFALALVFDQGMMRQHAAGFLFILLLSVVTYLPVQAKIPSAALDAAQNVRRYDSDDYAPWSHPLARSTYVREDENLAGRGYWKAGWDRYWSENRGYLPPLLPGDVLSLEGRVLPVAGPGACLTLSVPSQSLQKRLPLGPFAMELPIAQSTGGKPAPIVVQVKSTAEAQPVQPPPGPLLEFTRIRLHRPVAPGSPRLLLSADEVLARTARGKKTVCRVRTAAPTLVQLPLLYYRHMLEMRDNGKAVRYGNLGRFVAVELGPGTHTIQVRFIGVRWANWVSAAGWLGVLAAGLVLAVRRLRRGRGQAAPSANPDSAENRLLCAA
ncbi:MAG: hypothetical protein HYS12_13500 [Planctomycetes bacterium]|nr:hypothetical protein [Planctomycetota bacterium]